jgi:hypothetical protein
MKFCDCYFKMTLKYSRIEATHYCLNWGKIHVHAVWEVCQVEGKIKLLILICNVILYIPETNETIITSLRSVVPGDKYA